jgi:hypothetical protein
MQLPPIFISIKKAPSKYQIGLSLTREKNLLPNIGGVKQREHGGHIFLWV